MPSLRQPHTLSSRSHGSKSAANIAARGSSQNVMELAAAKIHVGNSTFNGRPFRFLTHRNIVPYLQQFRLHPDPGTPGFETWTYGEFAIDFLRNIFLRFLVASAYHSGILTAMMMDSAESEREGWTCRFALPTFCQLCRHWDHEAAACTEGKIDLYEELLGDQDVADVVYLINERYGRPDRPAAPMEEVSLCLNTFGDIGASSLAKLVHDPQGNHGGIVRSLTLRHNSIGDAGAIALANALCHSRTLRSLDLSGNPIGNAGIAALARALRINRSLTSLVIKLPRESPTEETLALLTDALRHNTRLCKLVVTSRGGSRNLVGANRECCMYLRQNYAFHKLRVPSAAVADLLIKSRILLHNTPKPYERGVLPPELWMEVLRHYVADGPLGVRQQTPFPFSPPASPQLETAALLSPSVGLTSPVLPARSPPRTPSVRPVFGRVVAYARRRDNLRKGAARGLFRDLLADVFDIHAQPTARPSSSGR